MLDNLIDQKYLPVYASIRQNSISVSSIQMAYIDHFKNIIYDYLYNKPVLIKIPVKDQNLIVANTMYK